LFKNRGYGATTMQGVADSAGVSLAAVGAVARSPAKSRALRTGLDVAGATGILYTIGGPETFRQLVRERAWPAERYERWLAEADRLHHS